MLYDKSIFLQWCESECMVCVTGLFPHFGTPLLHSPLFCLSIVTTQELYDAGSHSTNFSYRHSNQRIAPKNISLNGE